MNKASMSFLPEDYVEKRIEQRTNLICLTLFGVVLVGVIGAYMVSNTERGRVLAEQKRIDASYSEVAIQLAQLEELQASKVQLLRKAQMTSTLVEPIPRSNLLADMINRMPSSLSLLEFKLVSKKLKPPVAKIDKKKSAMKNKKKKDKNEPAPPPPVPRYKVTVTMVGVAPTDVQVASFMAQLSRSPLLSSVDLLFSEEKRVADVTMRKFKIEAILDDIADVRQIKPLISPRKNGGSIMGTLVNSLKSSVSKRNANQMATVPELPAMND